ncbi:MAG: ATP-dependent metallopeptidase FtsH/Yme1/Tma family protein [Clostridia bacterium]|nr:ATP-dependent metallopeptidase FtsH/Yme1/Tma family protein [Clostridia bacterium]
MCILKRGIKSLIFYLVLFAIIVSVVSVMYAGPETEKLIYSDLVKEIQVNNIKELSVTGTTATALRNDDTKFTADIPSLEILHEDVGSVIKKQVETGTLKYATPPVAEAP